MSRNTAGVISSPVSGSHGPHDRHDCIDRRSQGIRCEIMLLVVQIAAPFIHEELFELDRNYAS
jgi:hypothetical protein